MHIKDIHYTPFSLFLLREKVEEITRYLRLSAEYGESEKGAALFEQFQADMQKTVERYQELVLNAKDEQ